eukprot:3664245-Amphidinium_carterae.1
MALQLAMVDALERLNGGSTAAGAAIEREPRTLEDFLLGVGGASMSEEKTAGTLGGAKGLANMQRLARSIEDHPSQWCESFDLSIWRALSCDVTGAPWSLQSTPLVAPSRTKRPPWCSHRSVCKGYRGCPSDAWSLLCCLAAYRNHRAIAPFCVARRVGTSRRALLFSGVSKRGEAARRGSAPWRGAWSSRGRKFRFSGASHCYQDAIVPFLPPSPRTAGPCPFMFM